MLSPNGSKITPILGNQNATGSTMTYKQQLSLQQFANQQAVGEISQLIDNQRYLKEIKKKAKAINDSLQARINMSKGSIITSAFNRPLIPPNAHDRIRMKISIQDWNKYKNILKSYVDKANITYMPYGFKPIQIPSDMEIHAKREGEQFTLNFDYLALSQIMRCILEDSHKAGTPQEQDFHLWATSNFVQAIKNDDKQKESTTKKIGYARTAFSIASAATSGVIALGSYLGLFATPTLAVLGMSFPIATLICVGLCTLPFIITMIKNVISQIMDKTNDLDLELVKGTSKDFPSKGVQQAVEEISQTKQKAKQIEDNIAVLGQTTNIKHNTKEKQQFFGKLFLEECKKQNVKPEEMLEKCKNIDFVKQNPNNQAVAIVMTAMTQNIDIHEAMVAAKLKEDKQKIETKDLVDNVMHHSGKLNIDPIDGAKYAHNIDIKAANYNEGVLHAVSQQAKNHGIDLIKATEERLYGTNGGNILSNNNTTYSGNKFHNNDYYNNTLATNNNNVATTGIPNNISMEKRL